MKSTPRLIATVAALLCCISAVHAQAPAAAPAGPSGPILQGLQRFNGSFLSAAQAMPADKYNFAPSPEIFKAGSPAKFDTVRTFAQQITHVIHYSYQVFAPFGIKPDVDPDLKAIDAMTDKDSILKALQTCFDYESKVAGSITTENAFTPVGPRNTNLVAAVVAIMNDDGDHYGQMVEYLRMNGLVPPATERAAQMQSRPTAAAPTK